MSSVEFMKRVNNLYRFSALLGHLGRDQKTFMPAKGAESRGEMMAWLAAEGHSRLCDPEFGNLLSELEANDMDNDLASNVKEMRRQYNQAVKLPSDFVSQFTRARSDALIAWEQARAKSDFSLFS
jgi:carboxypeptidase Taq